MSKIKILETNKNLLGNAQTLLDGILEMQTQAEHQIKSIKSIEAKIIDIEKVKKEKLEKQKTRQEETSRLKQEADERLREDTVQKVEEEHIKTTEVVEDIQLKQNEEMQQAPKVSEIKVEDMPEKQQAPSVVSVEPVKSPEKPVQDKPEERKPEASIERPQQRNDRPQNANRPQGDRPQNANRPQGDRPQSGNRPQGDRPQSGNRPQGDRPQSGSRPQGDRPQSGNRPQGDRPQSANRPQGDRPQSANRPQGGRPQNGNRPIGNRPQGGGAGLPKPDGGLPIKSDTKPVHSAYDPRKKPKTAEDDNKNKRVKKAVIKERVFNIDEDEFPRGSKKNRNRKHHQPQKVVMEVVKIERATITEETVSVKLFSEKIGKPVSDILKKLLLLGMMSTINSRIDFDTAQLIAGEFGIELDQKIEKSAEDILVEEIEDTPDQLSKRPPVVTIMGHVDHGKTSLLDKIRESQVTESEAGGITQHIGAYQVVKNGEKITFIDTPGHEAFTAMRARGAQVTDIAIIVVAADDGIMPQSVEAINHAKVANVPIIVAINKIDKENANLQRIMQALTEYELLPEEWGGETVVVPVSAKTGDGIDKLLEMILLVAEVQELKANPDRLAKGTIIEAQLDKGRGPVATVLVETGTLRVGDTIIAGTAYGRVRAMIDALGHNVEAALPSQPVEVIGFSEVPVAGDIMHAAPADKLTKQVAEQRRDRQKAEMLKKVSQVSLDDLFSQIAQGQIKDLNIVIKADVQGSVEAVRQSLEKLSNEEVRVRVIHSAVGAITEADVMLASAGNAIIIGFNVRPNNMALSASEHEKVDIRMYRIIYKAIEDITNAMKGMLDPEFEEVVTGHAEIRQTFKVSSVGTIAGCYVTDGNIKRNSDVRLLRDNVIAYEGKLSTLKRFKDDAKEVASGYECGLSLENYNDIKELDVVECFEMREIVR